jgi:hypothetical protein
MLECERCGREGGAASFRIDPEDGVICKAAKACEARCSKRPDPLTQMVGLVLTGMQVASILQHPEEFVREVSRYSAGMDSTLRALLGQDESDEP